MQVRRAPKRVDSTLYRLDITSLAVGGDAVAHLDHAGERRAVFVPHAAPGDVIEASIDWAKHPARATVVSVVRRGESRRPAPCSIDSTCGGCPWMHLRPSARHDELRALVETSVLRRVASVDAAVSGLAVTLHDAPDELGYRTRARLALHGGRSLIVGYRAADGRRALAVETCVVLDPRLAPILDILRSVLSGVTGDGEASVALGREGRPVLSMTWSGELGPTVFRGFDEAVSSGSLAGASIMLEGVRSPAVIGDPSVWTTGADGAPLEVAPGGFAQANPAVAAKLAALVAKRAATAGRRVVELYAGSGFFTVLLARDALSYVAVESDSAAVELARKNLATRGGSGQHNVKVVSLDAAKFPVPRGLDVMIVDPPRAGCEPAVLDAIVGSKVRQLVYVSCDSATLARDAVRLVDAGVSLVSVDAFDMMPGTSHVEIVACFERGKKQ